MNIKRTIIASVAVLASVAMVAPSFAGADTISDLMAQIAALQAQLNSLSTSTSTSGSVPAACVGVTFSRNLTVGSTGSDVKCFQVLLNAHGYVLATTGAGSPGNETMYFGPKTLAAVRVWQKAQGWTPANQIGPLSRALLNSWLSGSTTGSGPVVTPTGAGLTVTLASNTPASGTVVSNQGLAPLARFTFWNGDNATVNVTSLKVTRLGVSADTSLSNVYLFNGAMRLTDAASVSSGTINFNDPTGLFSIPSGGSVTITVASDLAANSGETLGVGLVSAANVTSNSSSVKGNFPLNGNLMTVATASLAGVQFAASASTTPSTNSSLNPQNAYTVWQNSVVVSTRTVNLTRIAFREIGSVPYSALSNFVLNIDGMNVGGAVASLDKNGYVTFDMSNAPVALQTGTRVVKVLADVVGGSNQNFYFGVRVAADANFVDSQYGVNVAPTVNASSFPVSAGVQTVAAGTLSTQKTTDSPSGNIVNTASNAVLARYTVTAAGEAVKISSLNVRAIFTDNDACSGYSSSAFRLRNGAVYANGVQIGSTTNIVTTSAGTQFNFGSSLIVQPGTPVTLEIRGDIYDSGDTTNCITSGDTIQASLVDTTTSGVSANAQGQVSLTTINAPSTSSSVTGNTLTVAAGSLTLSKYAAYTNRTIVPPSTNVKLGHFTLTSSANEATNINTIYADLSSNTTNITNLYVMYGTQSTTKIVTPSATTLANSWSVNYNLPAGATIDVQVFGDVNAAATGSVISSVKVVGTTASSSTSVNTGGVLAGQTITFGSGTLNAVVDGTTPLNTAVPGSQEIVAGKYKFTASNDSYTIQEARFTVHSNDGLVISSAVLKDGSTVLGTVPFDSTNNRFYFTGLNAMVAANTNKILTLDYVLVTPYTDGTAATVSTGKNVAATLSYIKTLNGTGVSYDAGSGASNTNSSVTVAGSTSGTSSGNYVYVYKTLPTVTVGSVTGQGSALTSGSTTNLYNFTVGADAKGPVSLKQLKFTITINDINTGTIARLGSFKFFRGSTDLTQAGSVTILNSSGTDLTSTTSITTSGTAVVIFNTEEVIPAGSSYTYTLKATPVGFSTSTSGADSVTTSLPTDTTPNGSGGTAGNDVAKYFLDATSNTAIQTLNTTAAGAGTGAAANFIWSDNSAKIHDYSAATSSSDWFDGYLINNLPLDAIGVVAQ